MPLDAAGIATQGRAEIATQGRAEIATQRRAEIAAQGWTPTGARLTETESVPLGRMETVLTG